MRLANTSQQTKVNTSANYVRFSLPLCFINKEKGGLQFASASCKRRAGEVFKKQAFAAVRNAEFIAGGETDAFLNSSQSEQYFFAAIAEANPCPCFA